MISRQDIVQPDLMPLCNASLMSLSVSAVLSIRGHVDCYSI